MSKRSFLILFFLFVSLSKLAFSQNLDSQIHFSLNTNFILEGNDFLDYWKPSPGLNGEFRFDHPVGELGIGLGFARFDKKTDEAKSFYGINYHIVYRYTINLFKNIRINLGIDPGIFEFRFDNDDDIIGEAERIEREFAIKLLAGFSFRAAESINVDVITSYQHIYTKKKIELFYIGLGVTKSLSVPSWLKEILE